jgi:hypothetical protein
MSSLGRWCLPLVALGAVLFCPSSGHAQPTPAPDHGTGGGGLSDETELARAIALYHAAQYAECVTELDGLVGHDPPKIETPAVLERARVYFAACLVANGNIPKADNQLRMAIRTNPLMLAPDSLEFPAPVIERFYRVQKQLAEEIKAATAAELKRKQAEAKAAAERAEAERRRVKRLEEYAQREFVVQRNSRWLAAVPFGVGQFQNRDPVLGWIFLSSETLLGATAIGAMIVELGLEAKSDDNPPPDPVDLKSKLNTAQQVLIVSSWSFLAVTAVGITQAQVGFVPEFKSERKRPLPKDLRPSSESARARPFVIPFAAPADGGGTLGLIGRF